jgi:hypothetical protein
MLDTWRRIEVSWKNFAALLTKWLQTLSQHDMLQTRQRIMQCALTGE